jgi:hypothetical protein
MDVNFMIKRIAVSNLSLAVLLGVSVPVNAGPPFLAIVGERAASVAAHEGSVAERVAPLRTFDVPSATATDTAKAMVPSAAIPLDDSLVSAPKAIDDAKAKAAEARDADADRR